MRVCCLVLISGPAQPVALLAVAAVSLLVMLTCRPYNSHAATRQATATKLSQFVTVFSLAAIGMGMDAGVGSNVAFYSSQITLFFIIGSQMLGTVGRVLHMLSLIHI